MPASRTIVLVPCALTLLLAVTASRITATAPAPQEPARDAAAGRVLLGELGCITCHAPSARQALWLSPKTAPRLAGIANRASGEWIQRFLSAPAAVMPGTTMPDVLQAMPASERAAGAESLAHYLASQGSHEFNRVLPDRAAVARGEGLYHRVGCVACHAPENTTGSTTPTSPFARIAEKWSLEGLQKFLRDPLASRPSGRMPAMSLTDAEAADIAHYLLRRTAVPAPLEVAQFTGRIRSFEELDSAELGRTGPAPAFTLDAMGTARGYSLRFTGWLRVDEAGDYTFYLAATGASRLSVRDRWLVGEESWQRESVDVKTTIRLTAGLHALAVDYVQRGAGVPSLKLEWEGPGVTRQVIPASRLQSARESVAAPSVFRVDPAKAATGRALYAQLNCGVCHEAQKPTHAPPSLSSLNIARGCLSESPSGAALNYHLESSQRAALREAVTSLRRADLSGPGPRERLMHTMASFNCTACHVRDGVGGVRPERDAFFTSNGEDLGDRGRLPPPLDGVGDRLTPAWLQRVLAEGTSVRPHLNTRMPQYGAANVGHLRDLFVGLDRRAAPVRSNAAPPRDALRVQVEAGRAIVGTDGLSCIACHRFNRQPAHALNLIDLVTTTERLNEDWFRRFLIDPNRFHPGILMPSFWPNGVSSLQTVLGGNTDRQLGAIWAYLSGGSRAKFPEGLSRQNVELIVGGEAVVYRGKLWEAGFRAIAVGYPGQLNAAFDPEAMRLSLLWRGRFLNTAPHWGVQGMGQIRPLGTDVVVFPQGPALAMLADPSAAWPSATSRPAGLKFRGSQLDAQNRPTFLYSFLNMGIEDFMTPVEEAGRSGLLRTVTLTEPPPDGLYFRVAVGKIVPGRANTWRLDDALTIRVAGGGTPVVRGTGDVRELVVPVTFSGRNHRLEIEYVW